jgi:DNA-binding NarL/FixJ family response regulator
MSIRIVLADDDEDVRQLVRINLELDGRFEVVGETRDGIETISAIRRTEPDVALVDVDMPGSSGLEAVRRIRNLRPDVKVLVYSASGHEDVAADALAAGAHAYVSRTFDITKVGAKIVSLCSNGALAVRGAS